MKELKEVKGTRFFFGVLATFLLFCLFFLLFFGVAKAQAQQITPARLISNNGVKSLKTLKLAENIRSLKRLDLVKKELSTKDVHLNALDLASLKIDGPKVIHALDLESELNVIPLANPSIKVQEIALSSPSVDLKGIDLQGGELVKLTLIV